MDRLGWCALFCLVACSPAKVEDLEAGRLPRLLADPGILDFGDVPIGDHHSLVVTVQNPASVAVPFHLGAGSIEPCGSAPVLFCVERMPEQIAPSASAEVEVRFSPTVPRATGALLVVAACSDPRCSADVELRGAGVRPRIQCEPQAVDFGGLVPGDCRQTELRCTNNGTTLGRLESATIEPEIFAVVTTFPRTLPPGGSASLTLEACPIAQGRTDGTLTIATDRQPIEVPLTATGIDPELLVTPTAINFGTVALFAPRSASLLLRSVGSSAIEIVAFELPTSDFGIDASPPLVILPGEERQVTVTFDPTRPGPVDEALTIRTNDRPSVTTVRIGGVGVDLPPCRAQAKSLVVDIGPVEVGRLGRAFAAIENVGAGDCLLYGAHFSTGTAAELAQGPPETARVGPGETLLLPVELTPTELKTYSGELAIDLSNDGPPLTVEIAGVGVDNFLRVTPDPVDFGVLPATCASQARSVRILRQTLGSAQDRILGIHLEALAGAGLSLERLPTLPSTAPTIDFEILFEGASDSALAELVIDATIDGVAGTQRIPVRVARAPAPTKVERYSQLGSRRLDLLFVIETSFGIQDKRAALASAVPSLLAQLDAEGIDYQIGVTTADTGEFGGNEPQGRLLPTQGAPDRVLGAGPGTDAKLRARLTDQSFCVTDCYNGLEATRLAFSNPTRRTSNAGFLRDDATLSLVYLANHDDASERTAADYLDLLRTNKHAIDDHRITATVIAGDLPNGCPGADPGLRYLDWAYALGGSFLSICGVDSGTLASTMPVYGLRDRYHLTQPPAGGIVEVKVDGVLLPPLLPSGAEAYHYDAASRSVIFTPFAIPEIGADLEISYQVGCDT